MRGDFPNFDIITGILPFDIVDPITQIWPMLENSSWIGILVTLG